jgi:Trypsin-like peptidase domain
LDDLDKLSVRILQTNGDVIGTGFWIDQQHVLTCAHVVSTALGYNRDAAKNPSMPVGEVLIDPSRNSRLSATVCYWEPEDDKQRGDIALLKIQDTQVARSIPVFDFEVAKGQYFSCFGFPDPEGERVSGTVRGMLTSRAQLDCESAQTIAEGYSGAPVIDISTSKIVGMVVAAYEDGSSTAHMIPVAKLQKAIESVKPISESVGPRSDSSQPTAVVPVPSPLPNPPIWFYFLGGLMLTTAVALFWLFSAPTLQLSGLVVANEFGTEIPVADAQIEANSWFAKMQTQSDAAGVFKLDFRTRGNTVDVQVRAENFVARQFAIELPKGGVKLLLEQVTQTSAWKPLRSTLNPKCVQHLNVKTGDVLKMVSDPKDITKTLEEIRNPNLKGNEIKENRLVNEAYYSAQVATYWFCDYQFGDSKNEALYVESQKRLEGSYELLKNVLGATASYHRYNATLSSGRLSNVHKDFQKAVAAFDSALKEVDNQSDPKLSRALVLGEQAYAYAALGNCTKARELMNNVSPVLKPKDINQLTAFEKRLKDATTCR